MFWPLSWPWPHIWPFAKNFKHSPESSRYELSIAAFPVFLRPFVLELWGGGNSPPPAARVRLETSAPRELRIALMEARRCSAKRTSNIAGRTSTSSLISRNLFALDLEVRKWVVSVTAHISVFQWKISGTVFSALSKFLVPSHFCYISFVVFFFRM